MHNWPMVLGTVLCLIVSGYALFSALARPRTARGPAGPARPVTVFKPLCGSEPRLDENLATLGAQSHPRYQLLFGVRDPHDPAIAAVHRLRAAFPEREIDLVIDSRVHGSNLKVSNLINLLPHARYDWFIVADSDIAVTPDYIQSVTAPLANASAGIVTCLYSGRPVDAFWARVGALFIDAWFAPSVRVASRLGLECFGFGATIAIRRETLAAIGGFHAVRNQVADDFWLGQLTRERGLRTLVSHRYVTTDVTERTFAAMWSRELRWLRTIRSVDPVGFAFSFITCTFPMLALAVAVAPNRVSLAAAAAGVLSRLSLHWRRPARGHARPGGAWLAPLRDTLLLMQWALAFCGSRVQWRDEVLSVSGESAKPRQ